MVPKFLQKKAEAGFKLLATEKNLAEKGEKRVSEAQKKGKNTVWPPKFESKTIVAEFGHKARKGNKGGNFVFEHSRIDKAGEIFRAQKCNAKLARRKKECEANF